MSNKIVKDGKKTRTVGKVSDKPSTIDLKDKRHIALTTNEKEQKKKSKAAVTEVREEIRRITRKRQVAEEKQLRSREVRRELKGAIADVNSELTDSKSRIKELKALIKKKKQQDKKTKNTT